MSVILTPQVIQQATEILQKYFTGAAAAIYGREAVPPEAWDLAVSLGLVDPAAPKETISAQLHLFGMFLAHLGDSPQIRYGSSGAEWVAEIERNPIPRTQVERRAAGYANRRAAQYVVGLGNRAGATLGSTLIEADRELDRQLRATIRDVVAARAGDDEAAKRIKQQGADKGLGSEFFDGQFRSTIRRMASDMGHLTEDWARDWDRIAHTESQRAFNEGLKDGWQAEEQERAKEEERPIEKLYAYRIPKPDACDVCVRLYLEGGRGGSPRIFALDLLEANGDNVGLRRADWRPVVGTTHPFCACSLERLSRFMVLPKGWRSGQAAPSVIGPGGMIVLD